MRWIWFALASVASLVALAWAAPRLWRLVVAGASYKAKIVASATFVSGRALDPRTAPEVAATEYRILKLFSVAVDQERRTAQASLFGFRLRDAIFRPGLGVTLWPIGSRPHGPPSLEPLQSGDPKRAWPDGEAPSGPPSLALERVLAEAFTEPDPAMPRRTRAVLIVQDGRIVAERYAPGFTTSTPLPGWSMTKGVLSALVGAAVAQGRLSISERELLEQWKADGRARISIEDLLRMRSGLTFDESYYNPLSDVVQMLFYDVSGAWFAASKPLAAAPGTHWQYSSGTSNILSMVLLYRLREEYHYFPRRALFEPLGMSTAVLELDGGGTFVASSFMHASARDWARFGQLMLQDGVWKGRRILPEGWIRLCTTPTPQAPNGRYGAHWWLKVSPELGGDGPAAAKVPPDAFHAFGHEGQTMTIIPSRKLVAVRLGLSTRFEAWDQARFLASVLEALP